MLDEGELIRCSVYNYAPGLFHIYIPLDYLGIEPGGTYIENEAFQDKYRTEKDRAERSWYTRLYASTRRSLKNHKKTRDFLRVRDLIKAEFYNEAIKLGPTQLEQAKMRTYLFSASYILPIIKKRSIIPNGLIYDDEYWGKN